MFISYKFYTKNFITEGVIKQFITQNMEHNPTAVNTNF